MSNPYPFPSDFLWGSATASYQVEGAAAEDGRGPSIWDTFSHLPGRITNDDTGDVSVDQYHRYKDDVQLMKSLGLRAYRFSISWSRVFPQGDGQPNPKGIDYYDRLVDELLAHNIEPWPTLFHWDLPQSLEDRFGGWISRDTADRFADYASFISTRLSDRVGQFMTINEFGCFTDSGYSSGYFAPGKKLPPRDRNQVRHVALLAHGKAVRALRAAAKRPIRVGLAENSTHCVPVIETPEHIDAARKAVRALNAPFLTAVMEGAYLDSYLTAEGAAAPQFTADDMAIIGSPLDFVGINMYFPTYVRADANPAGFSVVPMPSSYPRMLMDWLHLGPQVAYWGPRLLKDLWNPPAIYITENGCAADDKLAPDGEIYDTDRVMYLRNHFINAHRAIAEGIPLKGWFVWSLLDNFEWCHGFSRRFGLVYVNYHTLQRIPKLSAKWYHEVIKQGQVV